MKGDQIPESLIDVFIAHSTRSVMLNRVDTREGITAVLNMWEQMRRLPGSLAAELAEAEGGRAGTPIAAILRKRAAMLKDEAHALMLTAGDVQVLRSKVRTPEHLLVIAAEFTWLADASGGE